MQIKTTAILAMALLSFTATASASNIVVNGDFEGSTYTGPNNDIVPTGWLLGPPSYSTDSRLNIDSTIDSSNDLGPESGSNYARFQSMATSGKDCLYQDLNTTAGMVYDFSFWVAVTPDSTTNTTFDAVWDENLANVAHLTPALNPVSSTQPAGYTFYSFQETASSSTTRIDFHGVDTTGSILLDNVSVSAVSATPEPGTWLATGSALLLAGVIRKRRK